MQRLEVSGAVRPIYG